MYITSKASHFFKFMKMCIHSNWLSSNTLLHQQMHAVIIVVKDHKFVYEDAWQWECMSS